MAKNNAKNVVLEAARLFKIYNCILLLDACRDFLNLRIMAILVDHLSFIMFL